MRGLLIWNFRLVYRWSEWLRSRFTLPGRVTLSFAVAAAALGIDTRLSQLYQGFALLAALLATALAGSLLFRGRFSTRRELPRYATVGETLHYRVRVHNRSSRPQAGLLVRDELQVPRVAAREYAAYRPSGERRRNWFDRQVGYPRYAGLVRRLTGAWINEVALPRMAPGAGCDVRIGITPLRRGYLRFSDTLIGCPDPLGLVKRFRRVPDPQRLLVLPKRYRTGPLNLPGLRRYQPGGVSLASRVGDSQEFTGVRDYRPGDPQKHIHWKSFARIGHPIVKQFQDEFFVRHALVLDTFAGPAQQELFEAAVSVAASYVSAEIPRDALLDLMFAGDTVHCVTAGRGQSSPDHLLEVLACIDSAPPADFPRLAAAIDAHAARLSGVLAVLLAWDPERQALIGRLRAGGVPVKVLLLRPAAGPAPDPDVMADQPDRFHVLAPAQIAERLAAL